MIKKIQTEKVLILNILISFVVLFLIILSQKHTCLVIHAYTYPWFDIDNCGRFPAFCYEYLFNNFLPDLFNIHPADFRSGLGIGCLILSILYFVICVLFTNAFFINSEDKKNIFKQKEFIFVFPLVFILLSLPLGNLYGDYKNYYRLDDITISAEFFFNYIPLFLYLYLFFQYVRRKEHVYLKKLHLLLLIVISFMTGAYNEITNLTAFFTSIIMILFLFFYDRERLFNKNILYSLISLLLGMVCYYVICNNFLGMLNGFYRLNFIDSFVTTFNQFGYSLFKFYLIIIKQKIIYLFIIVILSVILLRKKNRIINLTVIYSFSLLIGYIIVNFLMLFIRGIPGFDFLFERSFQDCEYVNILEYIILMLLGTIYGLGEKKKYIKSILMLSIFVLGLILFVSFDRVNIEKFKIKQRIYNIEKYNLCYSLIGERTIFPKSYLDFIARNYGSTYEFEITNYYVMKYYLSIYKQEFKGAIFVDDEVSERELDKRLELLDETKEDMNLPKGKYISFNNLYKKYKGKRFTSDELLKIEERKGKSPILTKAIAYAYYQEKEYDKSIELYKEYLKEVPEDFDANLNIGDMYKEKKEYEKALEYLYKLNSINEKILNVLFKLLNTYVYEKNDKQKAIEICDKMISIDDKLDSLYINKAIVYYHFGDKENAEKALIELKKVDEKMASIWLKMIKSYKFSEQKLIEPPLCDFLQ